MEFVLIALTLVLATANGANDVSKGIATVVGSRVASAKTAVVWGVVATAAGGLVAAFATQGLVKTFSGKGIVLVPETGLPFFLAIAIGAIGWLVVATMTGTPVSTTHSIFGALLGVAMVKGGLEGVAWTGAMMKVAVPLLFSPLVSLLLVLAVLPVIGRLFQRFGRYCLCIEEQEPVLATVGGGAMSSMAAEVPRMNAGESCSNGSVARFSAVDSLHWLSSGATSFFRGMNDTPKILAIGIVASVAIGISTTSMYVLVAAAMAIGGLFGGFRVVETLAHKVTPLEPDNGFAANLVTSILVGLASRWAMPVSTTHVASGAIFGTGVGSKNRGLRLRVVGEILLAWVITLPLSGIVGAVAYGLLA